MKKLAAVLMVLGATLMVGSTALAYPPGQVIVTIIRGATAPVNGSFQVRVDGCLPGEEVRFRLPANGRAPVIVICSSSGTAIADMVHPGRPGNYGGTAQLLSSGLTLPFNITTTGRPTDVTVPATGGGGSADDMIGIGIGAAALGAGLLVVARQRRRDPAQDPVPAGRH